MVGDGRPQVAVVDYGIGNLRSAEKALQHVGADARLTADPEQVASAAGVVVPGVGNFGRCAAALRASGLEPVVREAAGAARDGVGAPFLGICIGMQLLYEASDESPDEPGLGVLPGRVRELPADVKRPQMQWNRLLLAEPDAPLWRGLPAEPWVYFVHSYAAEASPEGAAATCDYGGAIVSAVSVGSLAAMQFHPEKSGANGLQILTNFVDSCRTVGAPTR
jgi:glutamine amidotransferase